MEQVKENLDFRERRNRKAAITCICDKKAAGDDAEVHRLTGERSEFAARTSMPVA